LNAAAHGMPEFNVFAGSYLLSRVNFAWLPQLAAKPLTEAFRASEDVKASRIQL